MAKPTSSFVTMAALAAMGAAAAGQAAACDGAGVITRIDGRPQDVVITRAEAGHPLVVTRPRVLEVVCRGDVVHVVGATDLVLAIDGSGSVESRSQCRLHDFPRVGRSQRGRQRLSESGRRRYA